MFSASNPHSRHASTALKPVVSYSSPVNKDSETYPIMEEQWSNTITLTMQIKQRILFSAFTRACNSLIFAFSEPITDWDSDPALQEGDELLVPGWLASHTGSAVKLIIELAKLDSHLYWIVVP